VALSSNSMRAVRWVRFMVPLRDCRSQVHHCRMFLAGIQAEFGLDPRLKHSGVKWV
jgi:hypothetical protein